MSAAPAEPRDGDAPALATAGQRLGGALVDGAAVQVAGLALSPLDQGVATAIAALAYVAYEVSFVAWRGQTLAKMALGTKVVDAATGERPTLWQAATRAVVPLAGVVVDVALGTPGVGALWVFAVYGALLFDERRRGLHDRAAGTVVAALHRTEAHRRLGVAALVVALAVTTVSVVLALDEVDDEGPTAAPVPTASR
ncbi:MAG: RDD family protein [Acidimicrobiales bacterium]